ncbi:hypothetical protein ACWDUL_21160 [Nocardia niigatensis]
MNDIEQVMAGPPLTQARHLTHNTFTEPERALLLRLMFLTVDFLATPLLAIENYRRGTRSGGGGGFSFRCTRTAVTGHWHERHPVAWFDNDQPKQWEDGALLAHATLTYHRLHQWHQDLPTAIRDQARIWVTVRPNDTHDYAALGALATSLLTTPPDPHREPHDLLTLLDTTT